MKSTTPNPMMYIRPRLVDKQLLEDSRIIGHYQGIHLASTAAESVRELARNLGKPTFVDPETYLYSVQIKRLLKEDENLLKPSVQGVLERYETPLKNDSGRLYLKLGEILRHGDRLDEFVQRVISFQNEKFSGQTTLVNQYYEKYAIWESEVGEDMHVMSSTGAPQFIIPPYFYFDKPDSDWYKTTLKCAYSALKNGNSGQPVYPVLLFSKKLLKDGPALNKMVEDYLKLKSDGFIIWPNDFHEEKEGVESLAGILKLVMALSSDGRPVLKLFGGYFSILLAFHGLSGFSCGLGYGQSKNLFAYGGGKMKKLPPKYYVPILRRAVELPDAERMLRGNPSLGCSCAVCREIYGNNIKNFSKMAERGMCEYHFMNVRRQELKDIREKSCESILGLLKTTIHSLKENPLVDVLPLHNWVSVIERGEGMGLLNAHKGRLPA